MISETAGEHITGILCFAYLIFFAVAHRRIPKLKRYKGLPIAAKFFRSAVLSSFLWALYYKDFRMARLCFEVLAIRGFLFLSLLPVWILILYLVFTFLVH